MRQIKIISQLIIHDIRYKVYNIIKTLSMPPSIATGLSHEKIESSGKTENALLEQL